MYGLLGENIDIDTHYNALEKLSEWGFNTSKTYIKCNDLKEIFEYIKKWEFKRNDLPLNTDGIVIPLNSHVGQSPINIKRKMPLPI